MATASSSANTSTSTSSPSKRPRSPEHALSAYSTAPPSKVLQSPSTRDSSSSSSSHIHHRVPPPPLVTTSTSAGAGAGIHFQQQQHKQQHFSSPMTALTASSMQTDMSPPSGGGPTPPLHPGMMPSSAPLNGSSAATTTTTGGLGASQFPSMSMQPPTSSSTSSSKTHVRSATTPSARIFTSTSSNSNSPVSSMHPTPPVPQGHQHQQHQHQQQQQQHQGHPQQYQQQQHDYQTRFASPQVSGPSGAGGGNYRLAGSQSGSTTSGFSGGSVGSSYDGSSMAGGGGGTFNSFDDPISSGTSSGHHGLGVLVQGPAYGVAPSSAYTAATQQASSASSSSSRPILQSPTMMHPPPASASAYYSQPYGYQSAVAPQPAASNVQGTMGYSSAPAYTTSVQQQHLASSGYAASSSAHPGASAGGPFPPLSTHHRRSIAGQSSAGGSSYHSGASASPGGHRRSDDLMMDSTFVGVGPAAVSGPGGMQGPPSLSSSVTAPYSTPVTEVSSPGLHKQAWSPTAMMGPGSHVQGHMAGGMQQQQQQQQQQHNIPSPSMAGFIDPSKPGVTSPSSSYYTNAQNYQAIVDEIMNQTRKGTDYGLDLGDFEMLDTLGTGTFGRVLLVRLHPKASSIAGLNAGMPHYFAMKVLSKAEVVRLKQVEHINCERSILGAVDHLGIVNLFCTFQDSLNIYMLLEFVQGGELFSHLRRAVRFSADVSRFYAANIILVLEYLHNRNLIYRDLKPENLLLDSHGYLKVTDFGFAKYVPDRTFTLCGTPEYLAPEIINSAGHGKAADWWAFGVLLFEMLCGYPPFFDESPWGIYEKILAGNFSFPPHVDPVARDLVRRLLSSDRSKRLGNLRGGAADVKNHQWFEGVDWTAVERRGIPAPIIPRIKSTSDSQNFERYPAIPIETLPGLARAKGIPVKEEVDIYEHMFTNF